MDILRPKSPPILQSSPPLDTPLPPITVYATKTELIEDVQRWAAGHGYKLTTSRSKSVGNSDRRKVYLACDHRRPPRQQNIPTAPGPKPRGTGCLFSVIAYELYNKRGWTLEYRTPKHWAHNHAPSGKAIEIPSDTRLERRPQPSDPVLGFGLCCPISRNVDKLSTHWTNCMYTGILNGLSLPPVSLYARPYARRASALCLSYAMGGYDPEIIIDRVLSGPARWSERGEFYRTTPRNAGLHEDLVALLSDTADLKQILRDLKASTNYHELEQARKFVDWDRAYWNHRALELCCYVFPRDNLLESLYRSVGEQLMPLLRHLMQQCKKSNIEIPPTRDIVEALVAASDFGGMRDQQYYLDLAAKLQKSLGQIDLHAIIVYRKSVVLRRRNSVQDSQRVIQEFLNGQVTCTSPKMHAILGLLHISRAENWACSLDFSRAQLTVGGWELEENPSSMQLWVLRCKLRVLGQSFKAHGMFEDSKHNFEGCLAAMRPHDSGRYLLKSNLADVYCELHYLQYNSCITTNTMHLNKAESIVRPEIESLEMRGQSPSKPLRRLLLSLVEIELLRGRCEVAETLIRKLLAAYNMLGDADPSDRVGHVRSLIAWARVSPPSEATARWRAAIECNHRYNPFEEEVFTCGVIYMFISLSCYNNNDADGCKAAIQRAREILGRKCKQFLIPGIGTYMYDFVRRELAQAGIVV